MVNWLAFDTETTGLVDNEDKKKTPNAKNVHIWDKCRMVQIAWEVRDELNNVHSRCTYIVRPGGFMIHNSDFHGITTDRAITEGHDVTEVIKKMFSDIEEYNVQTVVAHNIFFDENVIMAEMYRYKMNDFISKWKLLNNKRCTMLMGTKYGMKWPKLPELYEKVCGKLPEGVQLHTANWDTRLCADIYYKLM